MRPHGAAANGAYGAAAMTTVPSGDDAISNVPPNCRIRSFIPRRPTPSVPHESRIASATSGGMPLPWSLTSRRTIASSTRMRTCAVGLSECRCTLVRLSCSTRKIAISVSRASRAESRDI